jgi:hypothetical protein
MPKQRGMASAPCLCFDACPGYHLPLRENHRTGEHRSPVQRFSHKVNGNKRRARGNICAVSLLAKFPFWHYNGFKQTHCDRGKRRRSGAFREPVAGVNRRPGPFGNSKQCGGANGRVHHCTVFPSLPLSEHPATSRRGAPPTAHVKTACNHLQASRVAPRKFSVPGNAGQENFSFFAVISRRKKQTCWTSI